MVNINEIGIKAKTSRYVILGGIILVLIMVFGLFWYFVVKPQYAMPQFKLADSALSPRTRQYVVEKIIQSGNFDECNAAEGLIMDGVDYSVVCRNNIASRLAMEKLDMAYCDELDDKLMSRDECRRQVISMKVKEGLADESACRQLASPYNQFCLNEYLTLQATLKGDDDVCNGLEAGGARDRCQEEVLIAKLIADAKSVKCEDVPQSLKSDCKSYQAALSRRNKDPKQCAIIIDPRLLRGCINALSN